TIRRKARAAGPGCSLSTRPPPAPAGWPPPRTAASPDFSSLFPLLDNRLPVSGLRLPTREYRSIGSDTLAAPACHASRVPRILRGSNVRMGVSTPPEVGGTCAESRSTGNRWKIERRDPRPPDAVDEG